MYLPLATLTFVSCLVLGTLSRENDTVPHEVPQELEIYPQENDTLPVGALEAVIRGNNEFSTALYQELRKESGNLVMSPISIHSLMATLWFGATGNTSNQLREGLRLPEDHSLVAPGFRVLLKTTEGTSRIALDMANKLYIQEGFHVKPPFRKSAVRNFRSDAEELNFVNETEAARLSINKWVEQKTHNKIKDLIAPDSLSESTRLLAVNAIYFRGGWLKAFNENLTITQPFYVTPNNTVNVSMMRQSDFFFHGSFPELGFRAVKLLYRGPDDANADVGITKSMLILVPNAIDGLDALEANLSSLDIRNISNDLYKDELFLSLPRFKIESKLKLADNLKQLGITNVFQPGAELSGITDDNVYLTDVIQKAYIDVAEKGTEAAAATYYELVNFSGSSPSELTIDHPFLFFIIDEISDSILFMGRVKNPNKSEK